MPNALVAALHMRDAAVLDVFDPVPGTVAVPPLDPAVEPNADLVPHATARAAAAWRDWWESLLNRHPEFQGVPPLVPDPFPELDADLRALIGIGLPAADAWFETEKRRERAELRSTRWPSLHAVDTDFGDIVRGVEAELGRTAEPFDLLISILPVAGLWGRRVRRDHVLMSRALADHRAGLRTLLEPVVRELAQEP